MSIQWFPGHMAKARREVMSSLKVVDVVIEILDARLPESSRNPMMEEITSTKPSVLVLGKADLADPEVTSDFLNKFSRAGGRAVAVDNVRGAGLKAVVTAAQAAAAEKFLKLAAKGIRRPTVRAMVVGIPNSGKSSFINRIAGKGVTNVGDKPGITKQQQWIKIGGVFELLDTPGILWPKFDDPVVGLRLAWSGAIKSSILQNEDLALQLVQWLRQYYPQSLVDRYGIHTGTLSAQAVLEMVARRRGALRSGGVPDLTQAAEFLLRDLQTGLLGRISFDRT